MDNKKKYTTVELIREIFSRLKDRLNNDPTYPPDYNWRENEDSITLQTEQGILIKVPAKEYFEIMQEIKESKEKSPLVSGLLPPQGTKPIYQTMVSVAMPNGVVVRCPVDVYNKWLERQKNEKKK